MSSRPRRPPDRRRPPRRPIGRRDESRRRTGGGGRAQSTALDYTLSLALATIVITGLFIAAGDFVSSQRERVVRTELGVLGERIIADLTAADRLVEAGSGSTTVIVNQSLPQQVTGVPYRITVNVNGGDQWMNLSTQTPDVSVAIRFDTGTAVAERSVTGGDVSVVYTGGKLEVRS